MGLGFRGGIRRSACAVAFVVAGAARGVTVTGAGATDLSRERELSRTDGTTFVGEQVRQGGGRPPHVWRSVESDAGFFVPVDVNAPEAPPWA